MCNTDNVLEKSKLEKKYIKEKIETIIGESSAVEGYVKSINGNKLSIYSEFFEEHDIIIITTDKTEIFLQRLRTNEERKIDDRKRIKQISSLRESLNTSKNKEDKNKIQRKIDSLSMAKVDEPVIVKAGIDEIKTGLYIKALVNDEE